MDCVGGVYLFINATHLLAPSGMVIVYIGMKIYSMQTKNLDQKKHLNVYRNI